MNANELINQWDRGLRISVRAHYEASKRYQHLHLCLSLPAVAITALLGTTVIASLQNSDETWLKTSMAILSVVAVVFSSLQASLRFAERADRHKSAAVQLGEVRRALEQQIVFGQLTEPIMEVLRKKWDAADRQAPTIPSRIYNKISDLVSNLEDTEARTK